MDTMGTTSVAAILSVSSTETNFQDTPEGCPYNIMLPGFPPRGKPGILYFSDTQKRRRAKHAAVFQSASVWATTVKPEISSVFSTWVKVTVATFTREWYTSLLGPDLE